MSASEERSVGGALPARGARLRSGGFDEDFFLYCEDTDLGLRARWAGWTCLYAPRAVVDLITYSHTAGRATPLKAYYVERNRLFVLAKNFPVRSLAEAPLISMVRYGWHFFFLLRGRGAAAHFREDGAGAMSLAAVVIRAHWSLLRNWSSLRKKRRAIRQSARLTPEAFRKLLCSHAISPREVARL